MSEPRILTINHGASENRVVDWVKVRLNMGIEKYSREGGEKAIRIENLPGILDGKWLSSESALHAEFRNLEYYPKKTPRMPGLRIFTIMDTEYEIDRSDKSYISGSMFDKCFFKDRMVPIYNAPDMDTVFENAGIGHVSYKKPASYTNILDDYEVIDVYDMLKGRDDSNLSEFLKYCISTRPEYQDKVL